MKMLVAVVRELVGLFVDDGFLALGILMAVALAGVSASLNPDAALRTGGILLLGCLGALLASVASPSALTKGKRR